MSAAIVVVFCYSVVVVVVLVVDIDISNCSPWYSAIEYFLFS